MTDNEKKLIDSLKRFVDASYEVLDAIELETEFSNDVCLDYPFNLSFDEMCAEISKWHETLNEYYQSGKQEHTCSICGKKFVGWGNNPYPVTKGANDRCCDDCNYDFVIPARIEEII